MLSRLNRFARTPFAAAILGGLVVALAGWAAIALGWVEARGDDDAAGALVAVPIADEKAQGKGLTVNEIYAKAGAGVAHIEATGRSQGELSPFGGAAQPRVASGSGFVIDEQGHVITNAHVVAGASDIEVKLGADEESYAAEPVGSDGSTDIAVLKVAAPKDQLEPLELGDASRLEVGDPVVAIGNPFGLDRTVTAGIVSALQREIRAPNGFAIRDVIQTDAPINPGNSGGPLLDGTGAVVGVNSQIESSSGGNVGIGFAVPIDTAREIAQQLIADGEVNHAFLGIAGADVAGELAEIINLEAGSGVLIQSVVPDSPAAEAGLEPGDATVAVDGEQVRVGGDLIVAVDGEAVSAMDEVVAAVDGKEPGDKVELTVRRGDGERDVTVKLGERPNAAP